MKVPRYVVTLTAVFVIVIADQSSKSAIRLHLLPGETRPVISGFFNLVHLRNTGAVWGILQQRNEWLVLFSLLVLCMLALFYRHLVDDRFSCSFAVGCMAGGVIGNLIDRIKLGWVTDFLDFYCPAGHWPAFNIADAAICVGVAVYFLSSFRAPIQAGGGSAGHEGGAS